MSICVEHVLTTSRTLLYFVIMEIRNYLQELGFSAKEVEVYLAILRIGKTTPAKVAKVTKLNRPTVYSIVKTLISKGVIAEDVTDKALNLVPLPIESRKASIERSRSELNRRESVVDQAIQELKAITSQKTYSIPKIRFIEQGELKDFLFRNFEKWWKTIDNKDAAMYGFQDHSFAENYKEWIEWAAEKLQGSKNKVRLFTNASDIEDEMSRLKSVRETRFLDGSEFTSSTWAIGDYIVMIYTRVAPFYLVEIHDAAMAKNMHAMFKSMWGLTKSAGS